MPLKVWAEWREEPDWDAYVKALLLEGFRQAGVSLDPMELEMANAEEAQRAKDEGGSTPGP